MITERKIKKLDGISHGNTVRRTTPLIASQPSNKTNVYKDVETTKLMGNNIDVDPAISSRQSVATEEL
jgi:hypothetical protein